jgi:hypothetical protein
MLEINRAAALLGRKTQECNTRDKQELGTVCRLDQTIGLLSSQTALASSLVVRRCERPSTRGSTGLNDLAFRPEIFRNRQESFISDGFAGGRLPPLHSGPGRPQIADYGGKYSPTSGLPATSLPAWGLLHMLQALKHGRASVSAHSR